MPHLSKCNVRFYCAAACANAGKKLHVIAVHQPHLAAQVAAKQFGDVLGVDSAVLSAGLPHRACVVRVFRFLNPNRCVRGGVSSAPELKLRATLCRAKRRP